MKGIKPVVRTDPTPEPQDTPGPAPQSTPPRDDPRLEVAPGLLESKHREALGPAWHLYLNLLHLKPYGSAWVCGGRAVPSWRLEIVENVPDRTIRRWLRHLEEHGYIATEVVNTGKSRGAGYRIKILKAKEWRRGKLRVVHR